MPFVAISLWVLTLVLVSLTNLFHAIKVGFQEKKITTFFTQITIRFSYILLLFYIAYYLHFVLLFPLLNALNFHHSLYAEINKISYFNILPFWNTLYFLFHFLLKLGYIFCLVIMFDIVPKLIKQERKFDSHFYIAGIAMLIIILTLISKYINYESNIWLYIALFFAYVTIIFRTKKHFKISTKIYLFIFSFFALIYCSIMGLTQSSFLLYTLKTFMTWLFM